MGRGYILDNILENPSKFEKRVSILRQIATVYSTKYVFQYTHAPINKFLNSR